MYKALESSAPSSPMTQTETIENFDTIKHSLQLEFLMSRFAGFLHYPLSEEGVPSKYSARKGLVGHDYHIRMCIARFHYVRI